MATTRFRMSDLGLAPHRGPRRRYAIPWVLACALAVLGGASAGAQDTPGWKDVESVSGFTLGTSVRVQYDPLGNLYAIWGASGSERVAIRPRGGPFGVSFLAPGGSVFNSLRIGFDAQGNAIFAWLQLGTLKAARRSAGAAGTFGSVQSLGAAVSFDLSVNASGDALLVWDTSHAGNVPVWVAFRPAGDATTFGTAVTLATPPASDAFPFVVLDDERSAVAIWRHDFVATGEPFSQILHKQATQPAGSATPSFGTGTDLGFSDGKELKAENRDGRAVFVFRAFVSSLLQIRAAIREAGGSFAAPVTLSPSPGYNSDDATAFVSPRGDIGVSWQSAEIHQTCTAGAAKVGVATALSGAGFSAYTLLGEATTNAAGGAVAFGSSSVPLVAWSQGTTDPCEPGSHPTEIHAVVGLGSEPEVLSGVGETAVIAPAIASDRLGNAFAAWAGSPSAVVRGAAYVHEPEPIFAGTFDGGGLSGWSSHLP